MIPAHDPYWLSLLDWLADACLEDPSRPVTYCHALAILSHEVAQ